MIDPQVLARVDALQTRYVSALDDHDLTAWLACFAQEAGYVCITRENNDEKLPVALMMDDTRARLLDRVKFVNEVWSGTFEDYSTRHFLQRLQCEAAGDVVKVRTNFLVCYTNPRGGSGILVTGVYEDRVRLTNDAAEFLSKRAILDTVTTPRYLVYPV